MKLLKYIFIALLAITIVLIIAWLVIKWTTKQSVTTPVLEPTIPPPDTIVADMIPPAIVVEDSMLVEPPPIIEPTQPSTKTKGNWLNFIFWMIGMAMAALLFCGIVLFILFAFM